MNTIAIHHILVKSQQLADDLLKELKLGADFEDLAAEYSVCPSKNNQGFAGFHSVDQLPNELVHAIFAQDEGASFFIGPVATELGFHIIKRMDMPQRSMLLDDA